MEESGFITKDHLGKKSDILQHKVLKEMFSNNYYEDNFNDKFEKDKMVLGLVDSIDYITECENLKTDRGVISNFFFHVIS